MTLFLFKFFDAGSRNLREVLGLLFMQNIDHIINSDQANQVMTTIYHGNTEQVILGNDVCHLFLVGISSHRDDIAVHQIP